MQIRYGNLFIDTSKTKHWHPLAIEPEHLGQGTWLCLCCADKCHPRQSDISPILCLPSWNGPVSFSIKYSPMCNSVSPSYPQVLQLRKIIPESRCPGLTIILWVNAARHVKAMPIGYSVESTRFNFSRVVLHATSITIDLFLTSWNPADKINKYSLILSKRADSPCIGPDIQYCKQTIIGTAIVLTVPYKATRARWIRQGFHSGDLYRWPRPFDSLELSGFTF